MPMTIDKRTLATVAILLVAALAAAFKYRDYIANPWTRNGLVRANVIQVTPRVSAPIVELPIVDNQEVKAGDLLFRIDPRTFEADLERAEVELQRTSDDFDRGVDLIRKGDVSRRDYDKAKAAFDRAKADLTTAQLNLQFTEVRASVDGFVTNLSLRIGSQAVANQPVMALIDKNSFWVHGFFRETRVGDIREGDPAQVTLMSYPDTVLTGKVESIGWGIAQEDGSSGGELLPVVNPTFEWIRLAQRVPVRVQLDPLPDHIRLRAGTTASVLVKPGR